MQLDGAPVDGRLVRDRGHALRRRAERRLPRLSATRLPSSSPTTPTLREHGIEGYAGYPLHDLAGATLGLVSIASRAPLRHLDRIESMMQIFAVRAAAEIERLRADEALRSSEESYRTIFEAIEDGVVIHDWDTGALVDLNPKACEMSGFRREEVLGAPLTVVLLGAMRPTPRPTRAAISSSRSEGRCPPFEWRRRNRDGSLPGTRCA